MSIANAPKKLLTAMCVVVSAAAFATLGDGKGNSPRFPSRPAAFSIKPQYGNAQRFTLRSGLSYSADRLLSENDDRRFISLNTTVTYQKGNTTYIIPLKKKPAILEKIKFNPY